MTTIQPEYLPKDYVPTYLTPVREKKRDQFKMIRLRPNLNLGD